MKKLKIFIILALFTLMAASCSYFKIPKKMEDKSGNICTYTAKGGFIGCKPIK